MVLIDYEEIRKYLVNFNLLDFLDYMGVEDRESLLREIDHFTKREAERRDKLVLSYFGEDGVKRIVNIIVRTLISPPSLDRGAKILDAGAGSGFFTIRVAESLRLHQPDVSIYAMDLTPAMLLSLLEKSGDIIPFVGLIEDVPRSIEYARRRLHVPLRFNAIFSTLTLHHCLQPEKALWSLSKSLLKDGKAVIIDLCEHPFKEFREEMGDIHLGFKPNMIENMARRFFSEVRVEKLPGICCESSGRSAELFVATMKL